MKGKVKKLKINKVEMNPTKKEKLKDNWQTVVKKIKIEREIK